MTTSRFDPRPGEHYAVCVDCGDGLATQDDANTHMRLTSEASDSRSHGVRTSNPSREQRLESHVSVVVMQALNDVFHRLERLVAEDHATADEIADALLWQADDLDDAWREWLEEDQ